MTGKLCKDRHCGLCGWRGQDVRVIFDEYGDEVMVLCLSPSECEKGVEQAVMIERMAEEDAAYRAYESGNSAWAV